MGATEMAIPIIGWTEPRSLVVAGAPKISFRLLISWRLQVDGGICTGSETNDETAV